MPREAPRSALPRWWVDLRTAITWSWRLDVCAFAFLVATRCLTWLLLRRGVAFEGNPLLAALFARFGILPVLAWSLDVCLIGVLAAQVYAVRYGRGAVRICAWVSLAILAFDASWDFLATFLTVSMPR